MGFTEKEGKDRDRVVKRDLHAKRAFTWSQGAFGQGAREASFGHVVGGVQQPVSNHRQHGVLEPAFSEEIDLGWLSGHEALHHVEVLRGSQFVGIVTEEDDRIAYVLKSVASDVIHVFEDADHADDRRRVDRRPAGLIIERHVSAGDRSLEQFAGFGQGQH